MFMDAMLYTSVAKNMANGFGTFWFPQFSHCNMMGFTSFHEQPPLGFGLQGLFFKMLGNSMYTERIYALFMMCVTIWILISIWKEISNAENFKQTGWLPVVLWISIPVCFWAYSNNMLEVTMTVFVLLSVFFYVRYSSRHHLYLLLLSGLSIFLASFTKGLPGFFTLTMPFLYWLCLRTTSVKKMMTDTFLLIAAPFIIYLILFQIPESSESLSIYLFQRVLKRINDVPTVDSRFYILYRLFLELIVPVAISVIVMLALRIRFTQMKTKPLSLFFIFLGFAGSMPLLLTKVQKGFYFVPSLPFFAIGFALLIAPRLQHAIDQSSIRFRKYFKYFSILLFISGLTLTMDGIGKTGRDKDLLSDIRLMGNDIPPGEIIQIARNDWNEWSLQCYLIRYNSISVDTLSNYNYFIIKKEHDDADHTGYKKIIPEMKVYNLYKRE